ncbi:hypothetical protein BJY04DRAFT_197931 [Aspergillus karnatakaensis]|uniref:uncharacterized protein n=1 Tax=Aspergillus karnatakaensis TaxID=1810916 RepID=UPI003CCDE0A4
MQVSVERGSAVVSMEYSCSAFFIRFLVMSLRTLAVGRVWRGNRGSRKIVDGKDKQRGEVKGIYVYRFRIRSEDARREREREKDLPLSALLIDGLPARKERDLVLVGPDEDADDDEDDEEDDQDDRDGHIALHGGDVSWGS